jgi:hypothetical protein
MPNAPLPMTGPRRHRGAFSGTGVGRARGRGMADVLAGDDEAEDDDVTGARAGGDASEDARVCGDGAKACFGGVSAVPVLAVPNVAPNTPGRDSAAALGNEKAPAGDDDRTRWRSSAEDRWPGVGEPEATRNSSKSAAEMATNCT